MIAAARRRARIARRSALALRGRAERLTRRVDRSANRLLVGVTRYGAWTRAADRRANALLLRGWPPLERGWRRAQPVLAPPLRRAGALAGRGARWSGRRLRPVAVLLLRALSLAERRGRRLAARVARAARHAWALLSFERLTCAAIVLAAAALVGSQFVEYRGVEIGRPGYAGLGADPPTVGERTAGEAHAYLLVPVALLAAGAALAALRGGRRRLSRLVVLLGLVSLAVVGAVDLPAGLDEGAQASRFSGATAVLEDGFYLELAAAAGLVLGGLLYYAGPCRIRISSFARAASGPRRRRRRRASSRARDARRRSPRRSAAASAPGSRP